MDPTQPSTQDRGRSEMLIEESILPTSLNQRPIGMLGYAWIWVGIAVIIATYSLGAGGVEGGIPLINVIAIIALANLVIGAFMLLTADIGTEHGLSFAVYLRAPFGVRGTHLPALSRGVVAAMWFGIQTYLGALALNGIGQYFLGFDGWALWYVVFAALQVANTAMGIKSVERLASLAAPAILAISVWMYFTLEGVAQTEGINIWTWQGTGQMSVAVLFVSNMAFWSTLAIDIPNLTRFLQVEPGTRRFTRRNRKVFLAQLLALPVTQGLIAGIGAVSFIATGNWNPVEVIQGQGQGVSLVLLLALVVLAQWSTNNSANLIPSALTFINFAPRVINYKMAVVIAGIVGTLCMPWKLLDNLFVFLGYYGAFLSAIGGIMIADYYVLRRRRLNVPALYQMDGQFSYAGGFNPAGLIAWCVAGGIAAWYSQYAILIGFPLGLVLYVLLMKFWILPAYPQAELQAEQDDAYLATSVGLSWSYRKGTGFARVDLGHLNQVDKQREDI
ncbi:NCS1 family transporter [Paracoccus sp. Z330]|uniref:NCS1 family transporter n=1 Tax=Paracoccus onchidii TaxID=3017813 RepID=A0ABT4ZAI7_9RHOB|nr:NCS1 family transporter [Paracoccus onchidii]MDB6176299.1 NCS1 family transporter [Paracoccus onchidii]